MLLEHSRKSKMKSFEISVIIFKFFFTMRDDYTLFSSMTSIDRKNFITNDICIFIYRLRLTNRRDYKLIASEIWFMQFFKSYVERLEETRIIEALLWNHKLYTGRFRESCLGYFHKLRYAKFWVFRPPTPSIHNLYGFLYNLIVTNLRILLLALCSLWAAL